MPSLIELFESKKLNSGQTAQQQYDIQNLKPIPVKTNSGAIDLLATPVNIARRNFRQTLSESRVEQEALGLRQIRAFSSPILYGTDIVKLKLKQSSSVVTMKNAASTLISTDGDLTGILNKFADRAKEFGKGVLSTLGIQLPEAQLPTRVATKIGPQLLLSGGPISPDKLKQIQQASQGNGAGKILASIGQGATGEQIKNQVLGAGINAAKKAITKALFGTVDRVAKEFKSAAESGTVSLRPADVSFTSKRKYSKIIKIRSKQDGEIDDFGNYASLKGLQEASPAVNGTFSGLTSIVNPGGLFILRKNTNDILNYANPKSNVFWESPFPEFSLDMLTQNIPKRRDAKAPTYSSSDTVKAFNVEANQKFLIGADWINQSKPWYSETGDPEKQPNEKTLDDYDFIPLRFYSIAKQTGVSFKSTVSGIEESFSPSWDTHRFVGSPYNFYTYNSIERTLSFTFKVYSLNTIEHKSAWQRLNFLAGMVYPQNPKFERYTTPPFIKFTLGDMYKNKEGFIESLSYSVDDNTPWEIGLTATPITGGTRVGTIDIGSVKDYKLPTIINVSLTIKFLENITNVAGKRLYGYNGEIEEKYWKFNPDGTAKKPEKTIESNNNNNNNGSSSEPKTAAASQASTYPTREEVAQWQLEALKADLARDFAPKY